MLSLKSFLQSQRELFKELGVESPALSAEILLAAALGLEREALLKLCLMQPDSAIPASGLELFETYRMRRLAGEPAAYIIGVKEFYGRAFQVNASTLIPRPETELLVDVALQLLQGRTAGFFADLGTGSGCLAVTLALELGQGWRGVAVDISAQALKTALHNAERLGVASRLRFELADFGGHVFTSRSLDLLVSNPPYVSEAEYAGLSADVRHFEPKGALVPGPRQLDAARQPDGTEDLRRIAELAGKALKHGGLLLMEMGCGQGAAMREALQEMPIWDEVRVLQDLAGLDRVLSAKRR